MPSRIRALAPSRQLNATRRRSAHQDCVGVVKVTIAIGCHAAVLGFLMTWAEARAAEAETRLNSVCLNAAETREEVKARKLLEPFVALKSAAAQRRAEALSARLCHRGDEFIYEITLLHRDGRLVRVEMEASSGKLISRAPREAREPPK
jgi:hypothetical protein